MPISTSSPASTSKFPVVKVEESMVTSSPAFTVADTTLKAPVLTLSPASALNTPVPVKFTVLKMILLLAVTVASIAVMVLVTSIADFELTSKLPVKLTVDNVTFSSAPMVKLDVLFTSAKFTLPSAVIFMPLVATEVPVALTLPPASMVKVSVKLTVVKLTLSFASTFALMAVKSPTLALSPASKFKSPVKVTVDNNTSLSAFTVAFTALTVPVALTLVPALTSKSPVNITEVKSISSPASISAVTPPKSPVIPTFLSASILTVVVFWMAAKFASPPDLTTRFTALTVPVALTLVPALTFKSPVNITEVKSISSPASISRSPVRIAEVKPTLSPASISAVTPPKSPVILTSAPASRVILAVF